MRNFARFKGKNYLGPKQLELDKLRIIKKIKNSHILDSSGHYHIVNSLLNKYDHSIDQQQINHQDLKSDDLTVITQCSASRLYYIEDLLNAYHGPISLSIFALSKDIYELTNVLILLRKCLPLFRQYVKVNLVYPLLFDSFSIKLPDVNPYNLSCSTLSHQLASLRKHKDEFKFYGEGNNIQYPVNLLRNVARKNADTNYIIVLDIDLIPSQSLRKDFLQFIKQNKQSFKLKDGSIVNLNNDQIVFVLPTYEIDVNIVSNLNNINEETNEFNKLNNNLNENLGKDLNDDLNDFSDNLEENYFINKKPNHLGTNLGNIVGKNFGTYSIPSNKSTLLKLIKRKLVRPFYYKLCFKCQKSTNYEQWQLTKTDNQLEILYEISWADPYEPFYIALNSDSLPFYDERFRQYGFNRISQVCELHVAGYRFFVLNNHFLVHKGFKKPDKFHQEKDLELERNRLLFRQFKNDLKIRHPNSNRRCY